MSWKVYPLSLIFLLVFGLTDDAWARTTPDLSDDVFATENNCYLSVVPHPSQDRVKGEKPSPAYTDLFLIPTRTASANPGWLTESTFSVPFRPDPLYLFMSIQC